MVECLASLRGSDLRLYANLEEATAAVNDLNARLLARAVQVGGWLGGEGVVVLLSTF